MNRESGQNFDPYTFSAELIATTIAVGLMQWLSESDLEHGNIWLAVAIVLSLALSLLGFYIDHRIKSRGLARIVVSAMQVLYIATLPAFVYGVFHVKVELMSTIIIIIIFNMLRDFISRYRSNLSDV